MKIERCPYCGSTLTVRDGHRKDGVARLRCRCCGKGFNPLTGTVLDSKKIPISEWVEYLVHLSQFLSTTVSSIDNHNASTTGVYWLRKAFAALERYQETIALGDVFWLDETYLSVKPSEARKKEDGTLPKGLSKKQTLRRHRHRRRERCGRVERPQQAVEEKDLGGDERARQAGIQNDRRRREEPRSARREARP